MSQRVSGYLRLQGDAYETPAWVTAALVPHLPAQGCWIWEPAAGTGMMAQALGSAGFDVIATDVADGHDFRIAPLPDDVRGIITNPPYYLATEFIEHALEILSADGFAAFLLRCDFDSARTRRHLFGDCPTFAKKLILTKRIRWIADSTGSPSFNHAWCIWNQSHKGQPALVYT